MQPTVPYLSFNIDERQSAKISTESYINPKRPSLPAFGKLLLEIWKGTTISWGAELDSAVAECELDPVGEYWLCAVNACLGIENVLKEDGSFNKSTRMRSVFVLKVVKSLQWLFEKCVRLPPDSLFSVPMQPSTSISDVSSTKLNHGEAHEPIESSSSVSQKTNMLCLHDGSGDWELSDDAG